MIEVKDGSKHGLSSTRVIVIGRLFACVLLYTREIPSTPVFITVYALLEGGDLVNSMEVMGQSASLE